MIDPTRPVFYLNVAFWLSVIGAVAFFFGGDLGAASLHGIAVIVITALIAMENQWEGS